jgi:hypothetical protein
VKQSDWFRFRQRYDEEEDKEELLANGVTLFCDIVRSVTHRLWVNTNAASSLPTQFLASLAINTSGSCGSPRLLGPLLSHLIFLIRSIALHSFHSNMRQTDSLETQL